MRSIDPIKKTVIDTLGLLLSVNEANKLIEELESLIYSKGEYIIDFKGESANLNLKKKRIRIHLYDKQSISKFEKDTRNLIEHGKL